MNTSWQEAAKRGGVEWEVEKRPVFVGKFNAQDEVFYDQAPGRMALVRTDTQDVLSVVSDKYRPIQPARIFDAVEPIRELTGGVWEDARVFKGGRIIAGTLSLKGRAFEARPGDEIIPNIVFLGGFSGTLGVRYFLSSLRMYCLNLLAHLLRKGSKSVSVRHAGNVEARMVRAGETVEEIVRDIEVLKEQIRLLSNTPASPSLVTSVIGSILPEPVRPAREEGAEAAMQYERRYAVWGERVENILRLTESGKGNGHGTAWDLVNGITEYVDHTRSKQGRIKDPAEYITLGGGANAKGTAFAEALRLAA